MCCCTHKNFIVLEVRTSSGIIALPKSSLLEQNKVTSIAVRKPGAGLKGASGAVLAAQAVMDTAHLKVVTPGGLHIAQLPLNLLERAFGDSEPLSVMWGDISAESSTITLDTTASGYNAAHIIELVIGYESQACRV